MDREWRIFIRIIKYKQPWQRGWSISHSFEWKSLSDEHQWSQNNRHAAQFFQNRLTMRKISLIIQNTAASYSSWADRKASLRLVHGRYRFELVSSFDILWPR